MEETDSVIIQKSNKNNIFIALIFGVFFGFGLYVADGAIWSNSNNSNNIPAISLESFAKCIGESNAIIYGASWCHYCNRQKELFGSYVNEINFVDCDENKSICLNLGIEGYPTWIINDKKYVGLQELQKLSAITGCELK